MSFIEKKRFNSIQTNIFSIMAITTFIGMMVNVLMPLSISNYETLPIFIKHFHVILFYGLQTVFPYLLFIYILSLEKIDDDDFKKKIIIYSVPLIIFCILLVISGFIGNIYYLSPEGYVHGKHFYVIHWVIGFYLLFSIVNLIRIRKNVEKDQLFTMVTSLVLIILAIFIQKIFPNYFIIGAFVTLSITFIFFNIERPYDMYEVDTGLLNSTAMTIIVNDYIHHKKPFYLFIVNLKEIKESSGKYSTGQLRELLTDISGFINTTVKNGYVFCISKYNYVSITNDINDYNNYLNLITHKLQQPWKLSTFETKFSSQIFLCGETSFFNDTGDILNLQEFVLREVTQSSKSVFVLDRQLFEKMDRVDYIRDCLRIALTENKWLEIYLQPIYSVHEKVFNSAEVLLRFHHPEGTISPGEFIPVAEQVGLIFDLEHYVLKLTDEFLKKYSDLADLKINHLNVNISGAEFSSQKTFNDLLEVFNGLKFDPSFICLEMTESVAINDDHYLKSYMDILLERGFRFAIDDFGTGFSNLSRMLKLPIDIVKVDRSLLLENSRVLLEDTLAMISKMHCEVIIEGVEKEEDVKWLESQLVDGMQGYYYSPPLPADKFVEFIRKHNG